MNIDLDKDNLKQGVLGLVLALVEIIRDVLKTQAVRRMEADTLSEEEIDRLGNALKGLDRVIEEIKGDFKVSDVVKSVRDDIDGLVNSLFVKTECKPQTIN